VPEEWAVPLEKLRYVGPGDSPSTTKSPGVESAGGRRARVVENACRNGRASRRRPWRDKRRGLQPKNSKSSQEVRRARLAKREMMEKEKERRKNNKCATKPPEQGQ
jgi:hypothetical protein